MPSIKGTASVSSTRALENAIRRTKFPACYAQKVDVAKVSRPVMTQWIESRITEVLGFEDEIVQSMAVNLFLPTAPEDSTMQPTVDPRTAQIDLSGFLSEEGAAKFAEELWMLMLDAQDQTAGIPRRILEEKKKEIALRQEQQQLLQQQRPAHPAHYDAPPGRVHQDNDYHRRQPERPMVRPVSPPRYYRNDDRRTRWHDDRNQQSTAPLPNHDQPYYDEFGRRIPVPQQRDRDENRYGPRYRGDTHRYGSDQGGQQRINNDNVGPTAIAYDRRHSHRHRDQEDRNNDRHGRRGSRGRSRSPGRDRRVRRRRSHSSSSSSSSSYSSYTSASSSSSRSSRSRSSSYSRSDQEDGPTAVTGTAPSDAK